MKLPIRIELVGLSGAGKSALLRQLQESWHHNTTLNPAFEDFRRTQEIVSKHAHDFVAMQKAFYDYRRDTITALAGANGVVVSDFGLEADHKIYSKGMYAQGGISQAGWQVLERYYRTIRDTLPALAGRIFVLCSSDILVARIKARDGRPHPFEKVLVSQQRLLQDEIGANDGPCLVLNAVDDFETAQIVSWITALADAQFF